jgi:hypothetical protein
MLRKSLLVGLMVFLAGCDSDGALDCFQASGDIVQEEFSLDKFKKITVWKRVKLYVSDGPVQRVVVETGENMLNEIRVRVEDSILKVSDRNSCNFVRDYGITKVYVTSPNIEEIRNSSGETVESIGPIRWNKLSLLSEDREVEDEFHVDGDFIFPDLDVVQLEVAANGVSKFYLKGRAQQANFGMYDGDVRIEAAELAVNTLVLFHRSTNKMIVNPVDAIVGIITGLGDVISVNRPDFVNVEERFRGKLIFE